MKKIIALILGFGIICSLASCGGNSSSNSSSTSSSSSSSSEVYTISVYDLDDEMLGNSTVEVGEYANLYEALNDNFDLIAPSSDYGHYITSINGSIVDSNWSMMVYVNGVSSPVGIDQLVPAANDEIVIKNECWAAIDYGYGVTMDEYDVLVDKALYHYIKTTLKTSVESLTTYKGSTYWEMLLINLLKSHNYDESLFDFNYTNELRNSIANEDLTSLQGVEWGKYYSHAKQLDLIDAVFTNAYTDFVNLTMEDTMNCWTTPFYTFPAVQLEISSEKFSTISTSTLTDDLTWGPDGRAWQMLCQSMWNDSYRSTDLECFVSNWDNSASIANVLSVFAAINEDVRSTDYNVEGVNKDLIEIMFDEFYDDSNCLIKVYKTDTTLNMSTNQVYAGLASYKVWRDQYTKAPVNLLGAK